jgi:hypothetical protein
MATVNPTGQPPQTSLPPTLPTARVGSGSGGGKARRFPLHPLSGALLLGVDNLFFGANAMTGFLATPLVSVLAFVITTAGVFRVQRRRAGDGRAAGVFKALFCGLLAALPWSVAGTLAGTLILVLSGSAAWQELLRREPESKPKP